MPRRLTVECGAGHREEITIGIDDAIPRCKATIVRNAAETPCKRKREVIWDTGSAGFRVKGLTKRF